MSTREWGAPLIAMLVWGCEAQAPADPAVLLEADRAFEAAVERGGSQAWGSWFDPEGAVLRDGQGEIRGRAAVSEASVFLDSEGVDLSWEPIRAQIAASGDLGWTTGRYTLTAPGADGQPRIAGVGRYVSIWHLQGDGSWKVVMDLGVDTTQAGG